MTSTINGSGHPPISVRNKLAVAFRLLTVTAMAVSTGAGSVAGEVALTATVPHPRHWVEIKEGTPLIVPQDKVFVLSALGVSKTFGTGTLGAALLAEGVEQAIVAELEYGGTSMQGMPACMKFEQGTSLAVQSTSAAGTGRVWGYLAGEGETLRPLAVPGPEHWVTVSELQPFTVPQGKFFVATGGGAIAGQSFTVRLNGESVLDNWPSWVPGPVVSPRPLPIGLRGSPGDVVTVEDSLNPTTRPARLSGFLVDL